MSGPDLLPPHHLVRFLIYQPGIRKRLSGHSTVDIERGAGTNYSQGSNP